MGEPLNGSTHRHQQGVLRGLAQTERLGRALARACRWERPGTRRLYLSGELGSGKTTLVAALLKDLGVTEAVRSPSYGLLELYDLNQGRALHVDCYRLRSAAELEALGLRDYCGERTLWLLEWPEHVSAGLPAPELALRLEYAGEGRAYRLDALDAEGDAWLQAVSELQCLEP